MVVVPLLVGGWRRLRREEIDALRRLGLPARLVGQVRQAVAHAATVAPPVHRRSALSPMPLLMMLEQLATALDTDVSQVAAELRTARQAVLAWHQTQLTAEALVILLALLDEI